MKSIGSSATVLTLSLVLATALLGSAYTLWFEDLQLTVQASTTELDGRIRCGSVMDNETTNWPSPPDVHPTFDAPHSQYPEGPLLGPGGTLKDVATGPISDRPGDPPGDPHLWTIVVGNAYPGYALDCEVELLNIAPLPWHVESMDVTVKECALPDGPCVVLDTPWPPATTLCPPGPGSPDCFWGNLGINPPNYPDGLDTWSPVYLEIENLLGCQVHEAQNTEASMFIGINQSAKENVEYVIELSFKVNQWNESIWAGRSC